MHMKKKLLIASLFFMLMYVATAYLNRALVTPISKHGILDLELAGSKARFMQLRLFLNPDDVSRTLMAVLALIAAFAWMLITACRLVKARTGDDQWNRLSGTAALSAAFFGVAAQFITMLVAQGRLDPSVLHLAFYSLIIQLVLDAAVITYLLVALPRALMRKAS